MGIAKNIFGQNQNDEIVAVKSDLVLLPDSDFEEHKNGVQRPRVHLPVATKRPSFHIDPADEQQSSCSDRIGQCHIPKPLLLFGKLILLLFLLYFFVASLNLLASAFRLIGGKTASAVFQNSELMQNPVVGLMIGVIVTITVQSSSTSSSIIVSMVAAEFLSVKTAIPMIMGANIGTSITSTIVSFGQINDRVQFEKAFAGATVHDMFNFLTVLILLPLEVLTGYLFELTNYVLRNFTFKKQNSKVELLSRLTKPLTSKIVKIDKRVLEGWSLNDKSYENATLLKRSCGVTVDSEAIPCKTLTTYMGFGDVGTGVFLLIFSLTLLCICLVCIVRILSSILKGSIATVAQRVLNADLPYIPWLTGYLAILVGAVMTFLLQSSSIFTSSITPLVGLGMISLDRMYPLTLGSNLGTTTTAILAALTAEGNRIKPAIQIALVHFFFNLTGMLLFYPFPFTRLPIVLARFLGRVTAKYRWFSMVYLISAFVVLPLFVFSVSLGGRYAMYGVFVPILSLISLISIMNICQKKCPNRLPQKLQTWKFLPKMFRSLEPYDSVISRCFCCKGQTFSPPVEYSPVIMQHVPSFDYDPAKLTFIDSNLPEVIVHTESIT